MLVLLALPLFAASPASVARATLRAIEATSPRHPPEPFDVQAVLWSELPAYGAAACLALQRGEPVESDPIGTIAALPKEISDRLHREGVARNVARLRQARCRVDGPAVRATRGPSAPAWLDEVAALDIVPLRCEHGATIRGLAMITRRGERPKVADVVHEGNAGGYAFLRDLLAR